MDSASFTQCRLSFDDLKDATLDGALLDNVAKCRACGKLVADHNKKQGKSLSPHLFSA